MQKNKPEQNRFSAEKNFRNFEEIISYMDICCNFNEIMGFFFSENFHRDNFMHGNFFNEITFEFTKNQTLPEFTSIEGCSEVCTYSKKI